MSFKEHNKVKYFFNQGFYAVGDNATSIADGITDTSYEGEITIQEKIEGIRVLEISQYAFNDCKITKATIYAKLRSINYWAFCWCTKLQYINIPSSITLIGYAAFYLGDRAIVISTPITFEFNKGRTQNLFIDAENFARRASVFIIYPSEVKPTYSNTYNAFVNVNNWAICAPASFDFYTKQTTTNRASCPSTQYIEKKNFINTYNYSKRRVV